jgi:hypothetical protein
MSIRANMRAKVLLATCLAALPAAVSHAVEGSDDELRNTVVNILESLVQKGVLTRDQAQAIVADAQQKAVAAAKAKAEQRAAVESAEKDAVRVPYVPQIVKDQIAADVREQVRPAVTQDVIEQAKRERWGVAGALPEWVRGLRVYGDVRFRAEGDLYASDNAQNFYVNFPAVNSAGGIGKAGVFALLNTTEDRQRLVGRLRFGATAELGDALRADLRIASGSLGNPVSTNQTLGNYSQRWTLGVDRAALLWTPHSDSGRFGLDVRAGRFENPFASTSELIWDTDFNFEGVSAEWDWSRLRAPEELATRWLFATVGAMPIQEVELSARDKWLFGGQLGTELLFGAQTRLRIAAGYYTFTNVTGRLNAPDSRLLDFTAPAYLTKGNTLFDIRNDTDTSTNLYALAGKYQLASGLVQLDMALDGGNHVVVSGEYVKNIGWKSSDLLARTGTSVPAKTTGYDLSLSYGRPKVSRFGDWRASLAYRYLERDAVLDSFTDSDFHLGGTDARGYILQFDFGVGRSSFTRLRYMSANEIDGAPLGIDVVQLDLVGQF